MSAAAVSEIALWVNSCACSLSNDFPPPWQPPPSRQIAGIRRWMIEKPRLIAPRRAATAALAIAWMRLFSSARLSEPARRDEKQFLRQAGEIFHGCPQHAAVIGLLQESNQTQVL